MNPFKAVVLPAFDSRWFSREILSLKVINYICQSISLAGGEVHCAGDFCALPPGAKAIEMSDDSTLAGYFAGGGRALGLAFFAPAPTVMPEDIIGLISAADIEPVCLRSGKTIVAVAGKLTDLQQTDPSDLGHMPFIEAGEMPVVHDPLSAHRAQEILRARINGNLLSGGVFLLDPQSAFISPLATLAPGCEVLQNCQILGETSIGAGSVVGPNALISDSIIGENVRVNASQIYESSVGAGTTVGPFAYIRPGCEIGEKVRIGDFVELKKAKVGKGTKISHLTYIGDSELGERVNIGCGVVAVNYDGKSKHKTIVGDDAFVGCNVNLVAPLSIGKSAYLAAGSTITNDVESMALAISRARQTVKPEWVKKRREQGKL